MQPLGGVDFVSLYCSGVGVDTSKLYIFAEVVSSIIAEEALIAWYTGFNSNSIAWRHVSSCSGPLVERGGGGRSAYQAANA